MKKTYLCSKCDAQYQKWVGRCAECESWGTIHETIANDKDNSKKAPASQNVQAFSEITDAPIARIVSGIQEFDRVLGGGIVPSSLVLIGGEPGVGKSTLVLEVADKMGVDILYVSGEETATQIKSRLTRLNISGEKMRFLNETNIDTIIATIRESKPALAIIDSIQTTYSSDIASEPGSVSQVRMCASKFMETAKGLDTSILIIGHVTKDGALAGPKTLEHLVDAVAYIEGDKFHSYRLLRAVKNRFGSTNELGVFEMRGDGLKQVKNPSSLFLEKNSPEIPGSVITPILEGSRVFFAEIQSLVTKTAFGYPQRKSLGIDLNRLILMTAVLQKRASMRLDQEDIHINVTGGLKITEPASDLALCLSIASSVKNTPIPKDTVVMGEVGLGGEIRNINQIEKRIAEAKKLGFKNILIPHSSQTKNISGGIVPCKTLAETISKLMG